MAEDSKEAFNTTASSLPGGGGDSAIGRHYWERSNKVKAHDGFFAFNEAEQSAIRNAKARKRNPLHFKEVKISEVALLKMAMHARADAKALGNLLGGVDSQTQTLVVLDSVEGAETRTVIEGAYGNVGFIDNSEVPGRAGKGIGWYHSHPGYGCWLSGIDVTTQELHQLSEESYVAIVVDPLRTAAGGKVEIGAFRTYPKDHKPPDEQSDEYQSIPMVEDQKLLMNFFPDFAVHCKRYYSLDVTVFKSSLDNQTFDTLWEKYWKDTFGSSPLISKADYCNDRVFGLANKLKQLQMTVSQGSSAGDGYAVLEVDTKTPTPPPLSTLPGKRLCVKDEEEEFEEPPRINFPPPPTTDDN